MPDETYRPNKLENSAADTEPSQLDKARRPIRSDAIFCGESRALIAHGDEIYTLRITKQGKLLLNK
jgi:hemin uptake protein HemP